MFARQKSSCKLAKLFGSLSIFTISLFAMQCSAHANYYAICVNYGAGGRPICEKHMCVENPGGIREKCMRDCGYFARVRNVGTSNCTPNAFGLFEWKDPQFKINKSNTHVVPREIELTDALFNGNFRNRN